MGQPQYTDEQIQRIAKEIVRESNQRRYRNATNLGKMVMDDWDDDGFIQEMYEQYLQAVQQGRHQDQRNRGTEGKLYDATTTFEEYLRDAQATLQVRRVELTTELESGEINHQIYQNGKDVIERAEAAIKKYLEKGETARLIGV